MHHVNILGTPFTSQQYNRNLFYHEEPVKHFFFMYGQQQQQQIYIFHSELKRKNEGRKQG